MSKHTFFILVFTALITACGVDDPKSETTSSTSQGIGDPYCWDEWGEPIYLDEFEVGIETINDCYTWEDPGGGGGGQTSCSDPVIYDGNGTATGTDQGQAWQAAYNRAETNAKNRCLSSAIICRPDAWNTDVLSVDCHETVPNWTCYAYAQTRCEYTWW
jgi:hypothetical protein